MTARSNAPASEMTDGKRAIPEWDSKEMDAWQDCAVWTIETLAELLGVPADEYSTVDGTDSFEGDYTGTLINILEAAKAWSSSPWAPTKREYFAALAMQGLTAHSGTYGETGVPGTIAARAVEVADALLTALSPGGEDGKETA